MTKIEKDKTYRHRNCLDVDMHVVSVYSEGPVYDLLVVWINRHSPQIQHMDQVRVKVEDLENWEEG